MGLGVSSKWRSLWGSSRREARWKGEREEERWVGVGDGGKSDKFKQFTAFRIVQMCSQDSQETGYVKDAIHRHVSMYVHMCAHSPYINTQTYDMTRGLH